MARDFSSDILDGGDVTFMDSLDELSFHVWVKPDALTGDMVIFGKAPSSFNLGITLFFDKAGPNANNTLDLFHESTARIASNTDDVFTAGQWHSVAGVLRDSGLGELWVDGVSIGSEEDLGMPASNSNSLLVGAHSNSGDRRYWNGGIAHLTFWDRALFQEEITELASGQAANTVRPDGIIRHWDIAGDSSPEPESVDGTDSLTVSGTTEITGPTIVAPTLSLPTESDITETTAVLGCTTNQGNGDLHCFVSTSATAPSAADLKAGTGAVFHSSTPAGLAGRPPDYFVFESELIGDADNGDTGIGAGQSVATDGTWYFVSYNDRIYTYNSSWAYQSDIDTSALNSGLHTQVNGMFVDGSTLYVTANEYPATASSWVYQFSINAGTGALTYVSATALSAGGVAESPFKDGNGDWWVCSNDKHGLDKYNSSWVFQAFYAFPAETDPGGIAKWQGLTWYGDYAVVNIHNENATAPRADIYYFNGTSFSTYKTDVLPPTDLSSQGIYRDGDYILWLARETLTLSSVQRSTQVVTFPVNGVNQFNATGLSAGTTYYTYFIQDTGVGDDVDSNILESGPWATTGSGGTTVDATAPNIAVSTLAAAISMGALIDASSPSIGVSASPASVLMGSDIDAAGADVALVTSPVVVRMGAEIGAQIREISVIPSPATTGAGNALAAVAQSIQVQALAAQFQGGTQIAAVLRGIVVEPKQASIVTGDTINAAAAQIALLANPAAVELNLVLSGSLSQISVEALAASVGLGEELDAVAASIELTPNGATLVLDTELSAAAAQIQVTTFQANLGEEVLTAPELEYTLPISRIHYTFDDED